MLPPRWVVKHLRLVLTSRRIAPAADGARPAIRQEGGRVSRIARKPLGVAVASGSRRPAAASCLPSKAVLHKR